MAYSYINTSESIGSTVQVILKGAFQLGAQTLDTTLNPDFGTVELLALGLVFGSIAWMLGQARVAKGHATSIF